MTDESTHCCGGWLRCWCRQGGCGGGGAPRPHPGPASTRGTLPASPRAPAPAVPRVSAMAAVLPLPRLPLLLLLLTLPQVLAAAGLSGQLPPAPLPSCGGPHIPGPEFCKCPKGASGNAFPPPRGLFAGRNHCNIHFA